MQTEEENLDTNHDENSNTSRQEVQVPQVIALDEPPDQALEPPPQENLDVQIRQKLENVLSQSDNNESNSICMICMEEWTIGSSHNLSCLKCGHLFGRSCIEQWIAEKKQQARCPICNKPAKKSDLRDLWCKTIKASDATELAKLQRELELERKQNRSDSAVIFHQKLRMQHQHEEIDKLKKCVRDQEGKIIKLESIISRYNQIRAERLAVGDGTGQIFDIQELEKMADEESTLVDMHVQPQELKGKFFLATTVEASPTGGCRCFAVCPTSAMILVAQPAPPQLAANVFAKFGLRKFQTLDTSVREFLPLHSKPITSIHLKPVGDLILTSSLDKKILLTSVNNNATVQSFQIQHEPTCATWSSHREYQFYVGTGNCFVSLYDIRNTSEYIYQTNQKIANTRLLSISSVSSHLEGAAANGLLANDSKGCQYLTVSDSSSYEHESIDRGIEHLTRQSLPFDGLMGTVDFDQMTGLSLISTRHSPHDPNATHNLVRLKQSHNSENGQPKVECERVRTFIANRPGELLSQSRILRHPTLSNNVLVGASDDPRGFRLWDASDNTLYQSIRTESYIRDMLLFTPQNSNQHILYALSEKGLYIYRWDYA